jgi:hypothetical protein
MQMNINLHVSEINAAIALFSGAAEKIRQQAEMQAQAMMQPIAPAPVPEPVMPAANADTTQ